ncbi:hypothetical protein [Synechococcus sp. CBW1108]|uniref:hypothetical protein n=1 Tax=Synechococcus sp. CBW1108 TaxID=1353147 RepID=UPI001E3CDC53|nr:hypothetical protein [Synechococcus sp. CBW1108]
MTTTQSGRMEPTPGPTTALDFNHALLQSRDQARAQWAGSLAQFQAQMLAIQEPSLAEVVLAAAPAFALGFSFSAQKLIQEDQQLLRVTLRHRGGAEEFSEALAPVDGSQAWQALTASLLVGLLGIPVTTLVQANEPELQNTALFDNSSSAGAPAATELPQSADDEWSNPLEVQPVALAQDLEPLTEEEVATLHKFLAAMPPEVRKRFTIEFRHHFQVPKEARTIKDRITQQRHKAFIDVFERELAGVTP